MENSLLISEIITILGILWIQTNNKEIRELVKYVQDCMHKGLDESVWKPLLGVLVQLFKNDKELRSNDKINSKVLDLDAKANMILSDLVTA